MKKTKTMNIICIALMGVLLVLQFLPFWNYDGTGKSIQALLWLPDKNSALIDYLTAQMGSAFDINGFVLAPIFILVGSAIGIWLSCKWPTDVVVSLLPLGTGIVGVWGYLVNDALRLGSTWVLHLLVCIALTVAAAIKIYLHSKD